MNTNQSPAQEVQTLMTMAPTHNIDPPTQKKRNHKDALVPIPPSPPKLQKTTSSESNTKNKKGITPTTTIAAEDAFKPFNAIGPVNLMGALPPRLCIKTVANGLFHLIYVQELNGTEAFSHPVIQQLFPNPRERIGKKTDFVCRTGIIAAAPRRTSKALNIPIIRKASDHRAFKAMVYVSILDNNTATNKRNVLNTITDVSTENKTKNLSFHTIRLLTAPSTTYTGTRITSSSTRATARTKCIKLIPILTKPNLSASVWMNTSWTIPSSKYWNMCSASSLRMTSMTNTHL
jgi:hypothetical protein